MRIPRFKASPQAAVGYYHCISRVVDRRFILEVAEKEHFRGLIQELADFCEVQVLTFCIMTNHFHILLAVPRRPEVRPTAAEVLGKLARLSGHQDVEGVRQRFEAYRQNQDAQGEARYLATFHARMWDLSAYMKLLKQRFSQWFNARNARKGTLWEERFKSVLVEGAGRALVSMAAYVDLNPVRAGLVKDPKDYRWSGYGEAVVGRPRARLGLQTIVTALGRGTRETEHRSLAIYRMHLYQQGSEEREGIGEDGQRVRGALSRAEVSKVLQEKGRLPMSDYLRCRVRYFCDGAVLGSREFVDEMFQACRVRFGRTRQSGARPMRGLEEESLCTLRDLRLRVFG